MFRVLPTEHPSINGCLNLKTIREIVALDFTNWESADDERLIIIEYKSKTSQEDSDFARAVNTKANIHWDAFVYLPVRIQSWFNEQPLIGSWFYDIKPRKRKSEDSDIHTTCYRIYFECYMDAILFKLRWSSE
jgi:hypothetical protein